VNFQIIAYVELGENNVFRNAVCRIARVTKQSCIHLASRIEFAAKKFEHRFLPIEGNITERAINGIIEGIDETGSCMPAFHTDDLGF
jgi:hypothetical protein